MSHDKSVFTTHTHTQKNVFDSYVRHNKVGERAQLVRSSEVTTHYVYLHLVHP